ncbi:MAG: dTDP-4-dehydrorhamnose reductase, partial [Candidatus Eremiobacteraeota bacterium]|nr:dTDP-4-dehydrorhamnose reductase [Candidatus Eremiobacteraeota bacterium]
INEPLTTARFSALYGVWYPNARDDRAFGAAIVNQMLGYLLAVERIREIRPDAQFLITEDLQNFVAADARANAYADHKRERSYLSIDLACGGVSSAHPLWSYLKDVCGVSIARLESVRRLAHPPDLIGWNYYPNSERYLRTNADGTIENRSLFDALAVTLDPKPMLRAAWQRFGIPMALSEVHVMGTHRERALWLGQRYADACALRAEGVDLRAFGAWAAFGMVDWASLLCERRNHIEDGLFTCEPSGREPQLTIAGETFRSLVRGILPASSGAGWWERERSA